MTKSNLLNLNNPTHPVHEPRNQTLMDTKELIIRELEAVSEPLLGEVLDFVRFLKMKQEQERLEDQEDLEDARAAIAEAEEHGTISLEAFKQELDL
jgi:hypothetical protein